jgi:putative glutamine amidotransferase
VRVPSGSSPLVGVSSGFTDYGDYIGIAYSRPLTLAGAVPVALPYLERGADVSAVLDRLDAVVLGFGRDVEAARYGAQPHPAMTAHSPLRDRFELDLAVRALERGLPLLGICRGLQVLNVALGGTLYRDRSEYPPAARDHPGGDWSRWDLVCAAALGVGAAVEHPSHPIEVLEGSTLGRVLGTAVVVNSYHHQAVARLGEGIEPVAWAPDGIVEAIEVGTAGALSLAVQWELQESWRDDDRFLDVFRLFVEAARR